MGARIDTSDDLRPGLTLNAMVNLTNRFQVTLPGKYEFRVLAADTQVGAVSFTVQVTPAAQTGTPARH